MRRDGLRVWWAWPPLRGLAMRAKGFLTCGPSVQQLFMLSVYWGRASGVATIAAVCQARPQAPSAPARRQRSAPAPPASSSQASPRGPSSPAPPNRHACAISGFKA